MRGSWKSRGRRRGATAVEFALTAPILFLFVFASLEFGRLNMIRHTMENAVYEGARRGLVPKSTDDDVRATVVRVLGAVSTRMPRIAIVRRNANVTVSVEVDSRDQGWVVPVFTGNTTMRSAVTLAQDSAE